MAALRPRRASSAVGALLLLVLALLALAQLATARKSSSKGRCGALERTCGFITDGGGGGTGDISGEFAEARFTLTAADDGAITCDPDSDCVYDPDTGVLVMQTYCPGGSDYTVVQNTCAPLVPDPESGGEVLEPRIVGVYQNAYYEGMYCTVQTPLLPEPGQSSTWVINLYCVKGIPEAPSGGKVAAKPARRKIGGSVAAAAGAKKSG
jgi:hypothetical protein